MHWRQPLYIFPQDLFTIAPLDLRRPFGVDVQTFYPVKILPNKSYYEISLAVQDGALFTGERAWDLMLILHLSVSLIGGRE